MILIILRKHETKKHKTFGEKTIERAKKTAETYIVCLKITFVLYS